MGESAPIADGGRRPATDGGESSDTEREASVDADGGVDTTTENERERMGDSQRGRETVGGRPAGRGDQPATKPGDAPSTKRGDVPSTRPPWRRQVASRWSWRRKVGTTEAWNVSEAAFPRDGTMAEKARHLLRYAVLAPSSHNSQPWLFLVDGDEIRLFADHDRWLTVADPNKREMYLSLGAALENLLLAAEHFGLGHLVEYLPGSDSRHAATVVLQDNENNERSRHRAPRLFDAILRRRTNRGRYQERPIPRRSLRAFRDVCVEDGLAVQFVTRAPTKQSVAELVGRADRRQFADRAYRRELGRWIGRGAFGDSWPEAKIGRLLMTYLNVGPRQARKDAELVRNTPVLAALRTKRNGLREQLQAGQAFERVSLLATLLGVQTHPTSAPLEVPSLRRELQTQLDGPDWTVQHLFRLGYARSVATPSPRRSVESVLLD
ncbi:Acg family FMN-binding oxidoreductase [Halorussus halophilus]|uniref:Acg family FMN-binding oxidoreductase n=1 Tax=Halorussus halophilus TaxID=2650975 RepID=UPI0013014C48|nr:nitroreductase family protein [Halorussus halophilus]